MSNFYNRIEDEIMTAAELFFGGEADVWFTHDGFMTTAQVPRSGLEEYIKTCTGYDIKLDEMELCKSVITGPYPEPGGQEPYKDLHSSASRADRRNCKDRRLTVSMEV